MKVKRAERKAGKNARDLSHEASHRVKAAGEHVKRGIAGDFMTASEKAGSSIKEGGHRIAADVDKAKRKLRNRLS